MTSKLTGLALVLVTRGQVTAANVSSPAPERSSADPGAAARKADRDGGMLALRGMTQAAFGTLMALEAAMGALLGLVVLSQALSAVQVVGIAFVVLAGAGAQRGGRRTPPQEDTAREHDAVPLDAMEPK